MTAKLIQVVRKVMDVNTKGAKKRVYSLTSLFFRNICRRLGLVTRDAEEFIKRRYTKIQDQLIADVQQSLNRDSNVPIVRLGELMRCLDQIASSGLIQTRISLWQDVRNIIAFDSGFIPDNVIALIESKILESNPINGTTLKPSVRTGYSNTGLSNLMQYDNIEFVEFGAEVINGLVTTLIVPYAVSKKKEEDVLDFIRNLHKSLIPREKTTELPCSIKQIVALEEELCSFPLISDDLAEPLLFVMERLDQLSRPDSTNYDFGAAPGDGWTKTDYENMSKHILEICEEFLFSETMGISQTTRNEIITTVVAQLQGDIHYLQTHGCRSTASELLDHNGFMALQYYRIYFILNKDDTGDYIPELAHEMYEHTWRKKHVWLHPCSSIGDRVQIGNGVIIGEHVQIDDEVFISDNVVAIPYEISKKHAQCSDSRNTSPRVMNNCFLANDVKVMGSIVVGESSRIGDHVVLTEDVPPYSKVSLHDDDLSREHANVLLMAYGGRRL